MTGVQRHDLGGEKAAQVTQFCGFSVDDADSLRALPLAPLFVPATLALPF
jgi:hypothetical protein